MRISIPSSWRLLLLAALVVIPVSSAVATDTDGDGIPDVLDKCTLDSRNAVAPSTCDTDTDGYGNVCDADYNQSFVVNTLDYDILLAVEPAPLGTGDGVPTPDGTDMDCNGSVTFNDYTKFFVPNFKSGSPGPSGLPCAGVPGCT